MFRVGAGIKKSLDYVRKAVDTRLVERRLRPERRVAWQVDVGIGRHQGVDGVEVATFGGDVERCGPSVGPCQVRVCVLVEEDPHNVRVATRRGLPWHTTSKQNTCSGSSSFVDHAVSLAGAIESVVAYW